jgi:hypothetical protein
MNEQSINALPIIADFPSIPERVGTTCGVFSRDGKWFLFRYGVQNGQMTAWNQDYFETALWVTDWAEFCGRDKENIGKPFDSWVPACCVMLALDHDQGSTASSAAALPNKPK